jgi:type VI secretion system protein VasI
MNTAAKSLVFGALAFGFVAMPALGQETGESCAAIGDDAQRLACYDGIFRTGTTELPSGALTYESERLIPARPSGRGPATFSVACAAGAPQVSFGFAGQLVSATGDIAPVTFQVDQGQTQVRTLEASSDNTSLSFAAARDAEAFLNSLNGGTTLKVRMTPVGQRSLNVNFRLTEALGEIGALRESCR